MLVVRADAPWKTFAEFLADVRANPGKYNYGSSGNYGTMHVPMEMLKAEAGFRMTHIPYTGAGPAVIALLGGQVDALGERPVDDRRSTSRPAGCARSRTGASGR